jgi:hypothetical protein
MDFGARDNIAVFPRKLSWAATLSRNDIVEALDTIQQTAMSLASGRPEPRVGCPLDHCPVRRIVVARAERTIRMATGEWGLRPSEPASLRTRENL